MNIVLCHLISAVYRGFRCNLRCMNDLEVQCLQMPKVGIFYHIQENSALREEQNRYINTHTHISIHCVCTYVHGQLKQNLISSNVDKFKLKMLSVGRSTYV